eukprot:8020161-Alexandrium_andersonii.AAC.1
MESPCMDLRRACLPSLCGTPPLQWHALLGTPFSTAVELTETRELCETSHLVAPRRREHWKTGSTAPLRHACSKFATSSVDALSSCYLGAPSESSL